VTKQKEEENNQRKIERGEGVCGAFVWPIEGVAGQSAMQRASKPINMDTNKIEVQVQPHNIQGASNAGDAPAIKRGSPHTYSSA